MMHMRNSLIILIIAAFAMVSCKGFHDAELVEVNELLPVAENVVYVDAIGGDASLDFYATGKVTAQVLNDIEGWAEMTSPAVFQGDGTVSVSFTRNRSYRRMVAVQLTLEDKGLYDTLYFKQNGMNPQISCDAPYAVVDGSKDSKVGMTLNTNINRNDLNVDIDYLDEASPWIDGLAFTGDIAWDTDDFAFITKASSVDHATRATVHVWFADGWGEDISVTLYLTRTAKNGIIGTPVTLEEIRTASSAFTAEQYLEGYVISDYRSSNMAENVNTAHSTLDKSVSAKTAYISTQDGAYGARIIFDDAKNNVLKPGMKVTFSLDGVTLTKKENPESFTLSGIRTDNLLKVEQGYDVAPKVKSISELTAADIYTYVTLTDVEFINKAGAYTNVHEAHDFFDGWGSLLVDAQGTTIFAPINRDCNWRRTGAGVPQGSGTVTGIIVSEDLKRFANAGDWQIRVIDEGGFDMEQESNLTDFAVWKGKSNEKYKITANVPADLGTATLKTELSASDISIATEDQAIRAVATFAGKTRANNGMLNSTGLGYQVKLQGWYNFDENDQIASTNGLKMTFSTKGQTGQMVVYISFLAWGTNGFYRVAPAHWQLQYSVDGGEFVTVSPSVKAETPKDYVHLRPGPSAEDYHNGRKYFPSTSMAHGFCDVVYILPDVMDKDNVSVRFAPSKDGVLFDFPAESSLFAEDIEGNIIKPTSQYNGDVHFAEISFKTL